MWLRRAYYGWMIPAAFVLPLWLFVGWIAFNAVALGMTLVVPRLPWFVYHPRGARPAASDQAENPTAAYLLPFLAILATGMRIDGRDVKTVRPILCQVGVLPRTHGSALFTRGETQGLVVATLGTGEDEQFIDSLEGTYKERFLLHYNFPPYSVGETGRMGSPGRREIGHGKLAWRALRPLLPGKDKFPYTIRIVSEITESNGSSSMASVCGGSLSLMDAGVPMERPVAGIAMGLIKEGDRFTVLSDILGDEDHLGDMDFKVAGTEAGVTSLQMDIKITSITEEIMKIALNQAKGGRLHILGEMAKASGRGTVIRRLDECGDRLAQERQTVRKTRVECADQAGQPGRQGGCLHTAQLGAGRSVAAAGSGVAHAVQDSGCRRVPANRELLDHPEKSIGVHALRAQQLAQLAHTLSLSILHQLSLVVPVLPGQHRRLLVRSLAQL